MEKNIYLVIITEHWCSCKLWLTEYFVLLLILFFFQGILAALFFFRKLKGCKTSFSFKILLSVKENPPSCCMGGWENCQDALKMQLLRHRTTTLSWFQRVKWAVWLWNTLNKGYTEALRKYKSISKIWSVLTTPITFKVTSALSVSFRQLKFCCRLNIKKKEKKD